MSRPDASAKIAAAAPKDSNRTLLAILVTVVIVAGIAVAVFYAVGSSRNSVAATSGAPKGASSLGGPMVLNADAPAGVPVLDIHEDPQCPACALFEEVYGTTVVDLVATNKAKVRIHTRSFLDKMLRNDSSVRAANAAMCAADQGRFHEYVSATYAGQPEVEGTGYQAAQLEGFAATAGVPDLAAWRTCQSALTYRGHVEALEVNATKDGVTGTPTLRLNGADVKLTGKPADLLAAVQAATK